MKKSIFILLVALLGLGLSQAYAQDPVIVPTGLDPTCIDLTDPLHPVPGSPYTYEVNVPNPPGDKSYRWYVTQDEDFALNGTYNWATAEAIGGPILAAGSANYNVLTADATTVTLTWQSFVLDPGEYVFVVIYVENVGASCTNNNIKIYRILPAHAFTLDIANIDSTNNIIVANNFSQCVDDVVNAQFDASILPDGGIVYDYGQNIFYFGVAAANFSGQYNLTAVFDGLQLATPGGTANQTAEIFWGYSMANIDEFGPFPLTTASNGVPQDLGIVEAPGGGTVGQSGQMIYFRIHLHNNQFEAAGTGIDQYSYSFAVNGKLVDALGNPLAPDDSMDDLHWANCSPDLYDNDVASQVLLARPAINSVNPPAPGFLPSAP